MKKAGIYTGTGDSGSTSLCGGTRVAKDHPRVEAYGTLDELNAHIGLLVAALDDAETIGFITEIENNIFTIGCHLATENGSEYPINESDIRKLENAIDDISASLPPLKNFILPAGSEAAARANVCRTVCRRAERAALRAQEVASVDAQALKYLNRLSDYLYALCRTITERLGAEEVLWQP